MDRLIRLEPSSLVVVRIEPGQKCSGELTLRNVMYTMPVAFKLQAMNKAHYAVRPQSGIIPPLAGLTVEITYHLPQGSILPDSCPHGEDSFFLHSVVAPGAAAAKDLSSTLDTVPSDWFTVKKKQVFIDSGIKIMFVGSPVLARLVEDGSMDEIREVLERSDPKWKAVDAVNHDGRSLLHLAIARRRADIVQLLLEFEPTLETSGQSTATPLEAAVSSGESLIVELLLSRRASTERSEASSLGPIHLATIGGHIEILRLLLERGANVDALTQFGSTALHLAVAERRRDCVRLLLAAGARTDAHNTKDGDTPLHIAAALGDENMVKLLLHKGANKDIRNRSGKTPYDLAAENGHTAMFDALCLGDRLCAAARNGEVRTIHRLLETGAVVNGRDQHGWTALHRASFKGHIDAAKALLDKGIELDARDGDGYTALHCAVESGHGDMVELLLKKGADVAAQTNKGVRAMQIAQSLEYVGIMRILVHNGASREGFRLATKTAPASIVNRYMAMREAKSNGGPKMKHRRRKSTGRGTDRSMPVSVL